VLSLIVYGRNDAHGYNLHKRAALSLNALAHMLSHSDDEIIFVDYNTPDELPTFPETIADTLTHDALDRIRVVRVRPSFHAKFGDNTSLVALEPQSRNIGVRRANPHNRWILSTNTDMVFVPQGIGETLSTVCAALSDGYYHLPRFELPEGFWERASRSDPVGVISTLREQGRRYHLNEIVYGGFDNLYEGPGDFQLFLRDDLFAVCGFDERMILGWHVDTNIARRMRLLRGSVNTVFPHLSGYHCGHTRQATRLHAANRTENSLNTFAREVVSPTWTEDSNAWGAPSQEFEEFHLSENKATAYFSMLERTVARGEETAASEAFYVKDTYCEQGFEPDHVLPHLADIIFNAEPSQSIFVVASDREFIDGFVRLASGAPLHMSVALCSDCASPGLTSANEGVHFAPLEAGLMEADMILLQYPNFHSADPSMRSDLEWFVQHALDTLVLIERAKPWPERRRVIVVNGTHNLLQDTVNECLDAAAMPYSTRLRHGRVVDARAILHPLVSQASPEAAFCAALGRKRGFAPAEQELMRRAIQRAPCWERLALEISKAADEAHWAEAVCGVEAQRLSEAGVEARAAIETAISRAVATPVLMGPRTDAPNRLCGGSDWEDSEWAGLAIRYFGERIYGLQERSRWVWERISLLRELLRRLLPRMRPWVLVVSDGPDVFPALLGHQGYRVIYATSAEMLNEAAPADWCAHLRLGGIVLPSSVVPLSGAPTGVKVDAFLAPNATLLGRGERYVERLLKRVEPMLAPGAHLGASTLVHLNERQGGGALSHKQFATALEANGVLGRYGLRGDASVDARLPLDTVMKCAFRDVQGDSVPGLSFGFDEGALVTTGQLWARMPCESGLPLDGPAPAPVTSSRQRVETPEAAPQLIADTIAFVAGLRDRVSLYPHIFAHKRRNLIPFVLTDAGAAHSSSQLVLKAEEAIRFAVPIGSCARCLLVDLSLSTHTRADVQALLVHEQGVSQAIVVHDDKTLRFAFVLPEGAENSMAVFAIQAPSVKISVLAAGADPSASSCL